MVVGNTETPGSSRVSFVSRGGCLDFVPVGGREKPEISRGDEIAAELRKATEVEFGIHL
jgi:hypothetical protein